MLAGGRKIAEVGEKKSNNGFEKNFRSGEGLDTNVDKSWKLPYDLFIIISHHQIPAAIFILNEYEIRKAHTHIFVH